MKIFILIILFLTVLLGWCPIDKAHSQEIAPDIMGIYTKLAEENLLPSLEEISKQMPQIQNEEQLILFVDLQIMKMKEIKFQHDLYNEQQWVQFSGILTSLAMVTLALRQHFILKAQERVRYLYQASFVGLAALPWVVPLEQVQEMALQIDLIIVASWIFTQTIRLQDDVVRVMTNIFSKLWSKRYFGMLHRLLIKENDLLINIGKKFLHHGLFIAPGDRLHYLMTEIRYAVLRKGPEEPISYLIYACRMIK